jgi:hypothetical protein
VGGGDLRREGEAMVGAKMGQGTCLAQGVFIWLTAKWRLLIPIESRPNQPVTPLTPPGLGPWALTSEFKIYRNKISQTSGDMVRTQ